MADDLLKYSYYYLEVRYVPSITVHKIKMRLFLKEPY